MRWEAAASPGCGQMHRPGGCRPEPQRAQGNGRSLRASKLLLGLALGLAQEASLRAAGTRARVRRVRRAGPLPRLRWEPGTGLRPHCDNVTRQVGEGLRRGCESRLELK